MKAALGLRLHSQLAMTPQLQQAIRLLQLSLPDLEQEVNQMLEKNPFLELNEEENNRQAQESESEHPIKEIETSYWKDFSNKHSSNFEDALNYIPLPKNLGDHLRWQCSMTKLSERDQYIAYVLIESIDDTGYMRACMQDILDSLKEVEAEEDEVMAVLHLIQTFDPIGVGARTLKECLLLQLKSLFIKHPYYKVAALIIENYLEKLAKHQYEKIIQALHIDHSTLKHSLDLILQLQPKPGLKIHSGSLDYIIPDIILKKTRGNWIAELNPNFVPRLKIEPNYEALTKCTEVMQNNASLKIHLQEAKWFIKSIENRNHTLVKVAQSIVDLQVDFFEQGEAYMKPLVLADIAKLVGMHESTISRVTSKKYMHTPRGIFELKHFFSSHIHLKNGEECSSTTIRALMKKMVAEENRQKPLSDQQMADSLKTEGFVVARRTIAKYRDILGILPSSERRQLA